MAILGVIADDFTGAGDAASFLVKGGLSVLLYSGVPEGAAAERAFADVQAVVVALKSRTQETSAAVADSAAAARALLRGGARQLYFKYCSTFDSTPRGNIGPVADMLLELTASPYSLLCPALPVNGRVVKDGCLLVNGVPLDESPMKDHPLTPMWDADLTRLMAPQSRYPAVRVTAAELARAAETPPARPCYLVPDYVSDEDGARIAAAAAELPLLTGGSGLLEPLARIWAGRLAAARDVPASAAPGPAILLAGSCSRATLGQIACYQAAGGASRKLDPAAVLSGEETEERVWAFVRRCAAEGKAPLIYSSDTPERVKQYQRLGAQRVADALEGFTAALARRAVAEGWTRIISAGGETSGAVTKALGFSAYRIGESVAPGVPIMIPLGRPDVRLILKSGNFGQEDFFLRALAMTAPKTEEG